MVPQKHVSIVIPEDYWDDKPKVEFSVLDNYKEVVDAFYRERAEVIEKIETRFGALNTISCIDNEVYFFRYHLICLLSAEATPSGKLQAEITHAPLSFTIPDQFPVFFYLQSSDLTGKSVTCKRDQSVRDSVITVLKQLKRVPSVLPSDSGSFIDLCSTEDLKDSSMNYMIKISGTSEIIPNSPDLKLTQITYIRESLKRNLKIKLSLIPNERVIPKKRLYRIGSQRRVLAISKSIEAYCSFAANVPFMIKIFAIEQLNTDKYIVKNFEDVQTSFFVECFLAYGNQKIGTIMRTQKRPNPLFADTLSTSVLLACLPRETRLCCTLYMRKNRDFPVAWVNTQLFDAEGRFRLGSYKLRMWKDESATILGTTDNNPDPTAPILILEFINCPLPIIHPTSFPEVSAPNDHETPTEQDEPLFFKLMESDPLYFISETEKKLIWGYRWYSLITYPHSLAKVMLSVDWHNPAFVKEAHNLLRHWPIISPKYALELLDANFSDSYVREFALNCLNTLSNRELALYLLQLVQVIKYEPYHYSKLVNFLLKRAFQDFLIIGHPLFWHLRSELDINPNNLRFRLMIDAYIFASPLQLSQLLQQLDLVSDLLEISQEVKQAKTKIKRDKILQRELTKLNERIQPGLQLPLNAKWEVCSLIVEKCKWLDSFTVPLWLVFQNADPQGDPIYIIFKSGDDLRQDVLTLQMLRIMDEFWKQEGCDLHLTPYECVSTGNEMGMIEVVLDSETTANIQKMAGGATAVFKSTPLTNWLVEHNRHESKQKRAVENFTMSLAGYCVATYVLGIGDRHNDNIMVTRGGHLFHIDFAHFLGNVMKFHGFKRERAPFVLTPDFVNVIGGKDSPGWFRFVDICANAFNIIRKYSRIFISLFMMMLSTGIPQLTSQEDLDYLTESFCMGKDDNEAKQIFTGLINESLSTKATQLNFAIHILAHPD